MELKKISLITFIILSFFGCKKTTSRVNEINEIVNLIIENDDMLKNKLISLNSTLDKVNIEFTKDQKRPLSSRKHVSLKILKEIKVKNKYVFSSKDYEYFKSQNRDLTSFTLDAHFTNYFVQSSKSNLSKFITCYISIPIFSLDKNTAYVQTVYVCSSAYYTILKKNNEKWEIVESSGLWDN